VSSGFRWLGSILKITSGQNSGGPQFTPILSVTTGASLLLWGSALDMAILKEAAAGNS
jgi:hypothetical protein